MKYFIDKTAKEPAYLQLYRLLVRDITAGRYHFGDRLPSKRSAAEDAGVSVITADHALALLCEEGYAETRLRSGTFVTYRGEDFPGPAPSPSPDAFPGSGDLSGKDTASGPMPPYDPAAFPGSENFRRTDASPDTALLSPENINSSVSSAPRPPHDRTEFPFTVLARTMRRVLQDYGEKILVKSPNSGCIELRSEISLYLARSRGLMVDPSRIVVGSGAEYLYGLIVQLLGTDKVYALEDPSYSKIREVYEAMGASCELLPLTPEGIATKDLDRTKALILHVTPFNSFPSGVTVTVSKKHEYLRWARRRGAILIEDNYDSELTVSKKSEDSLCSMDPDADVIYLNTFSRTLAPSMRIGYMVLPPGAARAFENKLGFYSCTVPSFDQYVLAELLKSGDFERHINRVRRSRRRAQAVSMPCRCMIFSCTESLLSAP